MEQAQKRSLTLPAARFDGLNETSGMAMTPFQWRGSIDKAKILNYPIAWTINLTAQIQGFGGVEDYKGTYPNVIESTKAYGLGKALVRPKNVMFGCDFSTVVDPDTDPPVPDESIFNPLVPQLDPRGIGVLRHFVGPDPGIHVTLPWEELEFGGYSNPYNGDPDGIKYITHPENWVAGEIYYIFLFENAPFIFFFQPPAGPPDFILPDPFYGIWSDAVEDVTAQIIAGFPRHKKYGCHLIYCTPHVNPGNDIADAVLNDFADGLSDYNVTLDIIDGTWQANYTDIVETCRSKVTAFWTL